jgi:hypothetical protein
VVVGSVWKPYIGQAVGGELDLMAMIGGAEELAALLSALYKTPKNAQPPHIHPEDGNCSVCRNGQFSTFDAA